MMTKEVRDTLELVSETIHTAGWNVIVEDYQKKIESIKDDLTICNPDEFRVQQGRILAYKDIISLAYQVEHAFTQDKLEQGITED